VAQPLVIAAPAALAPPSGMTTSPNRTVVLEPAPPPVLASSRWPSNWVNPWIPLSDWVNFNALPEPERLRAGMDAIYQVRGSDGVLLIQAGNRAVSYAGQGCWLGFIPKLIRGQLYVHALDAQKFLQPLVNGSNHPRRIDRVIVLDPGHGGRDNGTRSVVNDDPESKYTLDWALRLQRLLVAKGWKAILTRSSDVEVPLSERVAIADQHSAGLFLSLHFNSAPDARWLAGIETYCLTPTGLPASLLRSDDDDLQQAFPNNHYDEQNLLFAFRLQRVLVQTTGANDRGVRHARFMGVLRGQNRPAVLIEGGYLSNADEARKLALPSYRQLLAEAVAKALE
jgi:N-acetylmuramoyl-L-alanine amidase